MVKFVERSLSRDEGVLNIFFLLRACVKLYTSFFFQRKCCKEGFLRILVFKAARGDTGYVL